MLPCLSPGPVTECQPEQPHEGMVLRSQVTKNRGTQEMASRRHVRHNHLLCLHPTCVRTTCCLEQVHAWPPEIMQGDGDHQPEDRPCHVKGVPGTHRVSWRGSRQGQWPWPPQEQRPRNQYASPHLPTHLRPLGCKAHLLPGFHAHLNRFPGRPSSQAGSRWGVWGPGSRAPAGGRHRRCCDAHAFAMNGDIEE